MSQFSSKLLLHFSCYLIFLFVCHTCYCHDDTASEETTCSTETSKPNIVWIIADDLSPDLGCYGDDAVSTPHIDRLARSGQLFQKVYATCPACSPSRSALVTGMYQTSLGAHPHRTRKKPKLNKNQLTVMEHLRAAGYYVTNSSSPPNGWHKKGKTDYNFDAFSKNLFDDSDWKNREPNQPFFAQVQIYQPHRPFHHANRDPARGAKIKLPPRYPDHWVTRADWANYLAAVETVDDKVGKVVARLKEEKLLDNTIIFFFADHGRPHVWCKQWLYEGGIKVPLIIQTPETISLDLPTRQLVSLLDIAPTTLQFAGVEVPRQMHGISLLNRQAIEERKMVFSARDRSGDAIDRLRCIRYSDGQRQFKFISNEMPEVAYSQHSSYKILEYPVMSLLPVLQKQGKLNSIQLSMMGTTKPRFELYDLSNDPSETKNLVDNEQYKSMFAQLKNELANWQKETGDIGAKPEGDQAFYDKLIKGKRKWYSGTLKKRGLTENSPPEDHLEWWKKKLQIKKNKCP